MHSRTADSNWKNGSGWQEDQPWQEEANYDAAASYYNQRWTNGGAYDPWSTGYAASTSSHNYPAPTYSQFEEEPQTPAFEAPVAKPAATKPRKQPAVQEPAAPLPPDWRQQLQALDAQSERLLSKHWEHLRALQSLMPSVSVEEGPAGLSLVSRDAEQELIGTIVGKINILKKGELKGGKTRKEGEGRPKGTEEGAEDGCGIVSIVKAEEGVDIKIEDEVETK